MSRMIDLGFDPLLDGRMLRYAALHKDIELVKWLLATAESSESLLMASSDSGWTVLHDISFYLSEPDALSIVGLILQQGVPATDLVQALNRDQQTPVDLARISF